MPYTANPYAPGGTAGDKTGQNSGVITVVESLLTAATAFAQKGEPVLISGSIPGVAKLTAAAATDFIPVDIHGIYDLSVIGTNQNGNVAIALGDPVYMSNAGVLTANSNEAYFGTALFAVASGATTVVPVSLGGDAARYENSVATKTFSVTAPAADTTNIVTMTRAYKVIDWYIIARDTDAANILLINDADNLTAVVAKGTTLDAVVRGSTIIAAQDVFAAGEILKVDKSADELIDVFVIAIPV